MEVVVPVRDGRRGDRRRRGIAVVAGCAVAATVSLLVPATLSFDAWAWLVWGREIGHATLDTTGGPSWKPLPVAVTTLLAPLGDLAPAAYLVVARTAALLAVVAVVGLATRLGGRVAGAVAAVALLVTPDGDPRFLRVVLEGHEAPWSAGLAVAALAAHLGGRHHRTAGWLWLLCLLRPEAWPFLLAHVGWRWRRDGRVTWPAAAAIVSVPLLWFVPDWIGSGSPLHGAGTAQVLAGVSAWRRLGDGLVAMLTMVPVPVWVAAAVAVARRSPPCVLAAALALAWSALVVAMAAIGGYAAISRFFLPAATLVCVLAGVGVVSLADALRGRVAVAAVATLVALALVAPRLLGVVDVVDEVTARGALDADLDETIALAGGPHRLAACDDVAVTGSTLLRSAVAWKLDLRLDAVRLELPDATGTVLARAGRAEEVALALPGAAEIARGDRWVAVAVRCPAAVAPGDT